MGTTKTVSYPCHKGNGWNYGLQTDGNTAKVYRYHTNGSQNQSYEYSKRYFKAAINKELGEKRMKSIMEDGKDAGQLERIFFNGI